MSDGDKMVTALINHAPLMEQFKRNAHIHLNGIVSASPALLPIDAVADVQGLVNDLHILFTVAFNKGDQAMIKDAYDTLEEAAEALHTRLNELRARQEQCEHQDTERRRVCAICGEVQ